MRISTLEMKTKAFKVSKAPRLHKTSDELNYIENLGRYSAHTKNIPRLVLLTQYFKACKQRKNWDDMDKLVILTTIQRELKGKK